ncbi:lycopene beta-cyclase [Nocardia caishijiensis]|uniref:Lycopene beta-cyclase n=1 Tax=Nocardia caishijiensis TaxID=184756 RepID=A0ABQ6YNL9_9NOCA|nr:lycopene beta-cyclase [Nocardia caishijiensis]
MRVRAELIICGLGPAGRAAAHRAAGRGMSVVAIDPHPERTWTATYAAWADEVPEWVGDEVFAGDGVEPTVWAVGEHRVRRDYRVFDTARLRQALALTGVTVCADRVTHLDARRGMVRTAGGRTFEGRVIDARGVGRARGRAEQTAYGVTVEADGPCVFMDWRLDNGAGPDEPRSFLYTVPVGPGRMLYEETCLVGRPALTPEVLRTRLEHRLGQRGIAIGGTEPVERVRFPVEGGQPGGGRFGAAGGLIHPATGYSVAASLAAADTVVDGASLWTPRARAVAALRRAGLRALLALPPREVPVFFEAFFALAPARQRSYLSGHDDLTGTLAAMRALFTELPPRVRRTVAISSLGLR